MISETDIQIGDWLHLEYTNSIDGFVSFNFKVSQLRRDYGDELLVWGEKTPDGKHFGNMGGVSKIQPIPLTAKILEKNGFVYTKPQMPTESEDMVWQYRNDEEQTLIEIEEQTDDNLLDYYIGYFAGGANSCEIYFKHVHQLQHALRLCGIEKEIEL